MAQEIANIRPAVISTPKASSLDELRRFRHLVRNVYAFTLVPDNMKTLISDLPELWPQVQAELLDFADFLSEVAQANPKVPMLFIITVSDNASIPKTSPKSTVSAVDP